MFNPVKSIASRYSTKKVNQKYFCGVDLANSGDTSVVISRVLSEQGYVFAPYIIIQGTPIISGLETVEEKAERIREERKKKLDRIYKNNI